MATLIKKNIKLQLHREKETTLFPLNKWRLGGCLLYVTDTESHVGVKCESALKANLYDEERF